MSTGQEAVLVAADAEEEMLPESEEIALALNVEELRFWVKQVCHHCFLSHLTQRESRSIANGTFSIQQIDKRALQWIKSFLLAIFIAIIESKYRCQYDRGLTGGS